MNAALEITFIMNFRIGQTYFLVRCIVVITRSECDVMCSTVQPTGRFVVGLLHIFCTLVHRNYEPHRSFSTVPLGVVATLHMLERQLCLLKALARLVLGEVCCVILTLLGRTFNDPVQHFHSLLLCQ